jgi:hypothetical protein
VSTAGDVNGDGYDDIIVGAEFYDNAQGNEGAVYLWYGGLDGLGESDVTADWMYESNQANTDLGASVGTAGDVNGDGYADIVAGAPYYEAGQDNEGAVYLWYGSARGMGFGGRPPDWKRETNHTDDLFGFSVGTAGDVNGDGYSDVLIGAPYTDEGGNNAGKIYAYYGSPGTPPTFAGSGNPEPQSGGDAEFGFAVGTAGDVNGDGYSDIIVGAPGFDVPAGNNGGKVFVWHGSADSWWIMNEAPIGDFEGEHGGDQFGYAVGTAGDVNGDGYDDIIVGARCYSDGPYCEGAVYVWYGSKDGLYTGDSWMYQSDQGDTDLGYSVGTAGDVNADGYSDIIAGAPYHDIGANDDNRGKVYVWYGSAGGMGEDQRGADWWADGEYGGDMFGYSVAGAGDVNGDGYSDVIVGADKYEAGQENEGAVYIWYGSAGGMGQRQRDPDWMYESDKLQAWFGSAVGTAGDVNGDGYSDLLIGAPRFDGTYNNEGRGFVFHGSPQGLSSYTPDGIEGEQENARLGLAVGGAGDVDGDGYSDVIVGAPYFDNGQASEGRVYLYQGASSGIVTDTVWIAESNQANTQLGSAVGSAGDVNGDGYGDVIVGAPGYANGQVEEGAAFVWHGSIYGMGSSGDLTTASWKGEGGQAQAYFGSAVAAAGDVNGDGYGDVSVGAYGYDNGESNEGIARVYYGTASGLTTSPAWTAEGNQDSAAFGRSVGSAGDVNDDGYSDVIVGAYKHTNGELNEGRACVYHGDQSGLSSTPDWTAESDQIQAFLGYSVGTAGDVNGDGYSDVIVGADQFDHGDTLDPGATWRDVDEGAAFVWYGSQDGLGADGTPANAGWMMDGGQPQAFFGTSVSTAGDVNGDGYSDVIVGAPAYNNGPEGEGRAFVYDGSPDGLSATAHWTAEGDQAGAGFGSAVAAVGDITGDGFADVVVGAPNYDHVELGSTDEDVGLARLYHGNGKGALSLLPRQMRVSAADSIAPLGMSDSGTAVELRLNGRMPLSCDRFKLEWQVASLGTPFWGASVISGTSALWIDTCFNGEEIVQQVDGLSPGTPYHWRVRLIYSGNPLGLGASRWFSPSWNGWQELDFRTSGQISQSRVYLPIVLRHHSD